MSERKIVIRKGGWRMDAMPYIQAVRRFLVEEIENRRHAVRLPHDALKGMRFKDNSSMVARVESNYTEEEFMACPREAVDAMLVDAAQSDWWYEKEKDWDDEHYAEPEEAEDDE